MNPSPADALPLPPRPDLEQYKKRAKDLVKACESGDPAAIRNWAVEWIGALATLLSVPNEPRFRAAAERRVDLIEEFARDKLSSSDPARAKCTLAHAQFVIARAHGFESWPKLAEHLEALARASSPVSAFEAAADAVVTGDVTTLARLLRENPELVRARSTREHHATLLHYVGANGFENYRQKSPKNAVEVAKMLLDAGAEVDSLTQGGMGRSGTTLGLIATSVHPARAGVQLALLELLLDYGAAIDGAPGGWNPLLAALANGQGASAEFLAGRGARLDLEGAAGAGQLDFVRSYFNDDGTLKPTATQAQMEAGFGWACEYGRNSVVEFLLERGVDLRAGENTGETGLHWAVVGGQMETIQQLLRRGAPLEALNVYGGTVLGQAVWSAYNDESGFDYVPILETLITAGARVDAYPGLKERVDALLRRRGGTSA